MHMHINPTDNPGLPLKDLGKNVQVSRLPNIHSPEQWGRLPS